MQALNIVVALVIGEEEGGVCPQTGTHQAVDHTRHLFLTLNDVQWRVLAGKRGRNYEAYLGQRSRFEVIVVVTFAVIQPLILIPALKEGHGVDELKFRRAAQAQQAQIIEFPTDAVVFQQIDNGRKIQGAAWKFMVLGNPAGSASPQRNAIGQGRAELIAEIVAAQGEGIRQRVVVGDIRSVVVAERALPVREIKPIHLPVIPLAVDRLPVMGDIFCVMQLKMVGLYRTSLSIRL